MIRSFSVAIKPVKLGKRLSEIDRFFAAGILSGMDMSGQTYGLYGFLGIFLFISIILFKELQSKQRKLLKPNTLLYIITYLSTKPNYLPGIKLRQVYGMNGMLFKDGVPTIGRISISQKYCSRR